MVTGASRSVPCAVTTMTWRRWSAGSVAMIWSRVYPSTSGIRRSSRRRSGGAIRSRWRAAHHIRIVIDHQGPPHPPQAAEGRLQVLDRHRLGEVGHDLGQGQRRLPAPDRTDDHRQMLQSGWRS